MIAGTGISLEVGFESSLFHIHSLTINIVQGAGVLYIFCLDNIASGLLIEMGVCGKWSVQTNKHTYVGGGLTQVSPNN